MIFVDTSIWIDHFRAGDDELERLLADGEVVCHPMVVGELAIGNLGQRRQTLALLKRIPEVNVGSHREVLEFIETHGLVGKGIGYVNVHLLVSTCLTLETRLWTRDARLRAVAEVFSVAASLARLH